MSKFNLQEETELMMAYAIIKNFYSKIYVDWAIKLIDEGCESESLFILASLNNDEDSITVKTYFEHTARDLNLNIDIDEKQLFDKYLIHILKNSVEDIQLIDDTVLLLEYFIDDTSYYKNKHFNFLYMYDELEEKEEYALKKFKSFLNEITD